MSLLTVKVFQSAALGVSQAQFRLRKKVLFLIGWQVLPKMATTRSSLMISKLPLDMK